jgi:GTP-binding protein
MKSAPHVAIVGRPNVGKSTLFNRITGKRQALVHSSPGVTRDVQRMQADWSGVVFELIDTGGLLSGIDDDLVHAVENRAIEEAMSADAMILVTDAESGITPADRGIAERIRETGAPVFLAVNKSEKAGNRYADAEFFELGFEVVLPISALHGEGIGDLLDVVVEVLPKTSGVQIEEDLKLALVGRPNVGKSSLINALIGEDTQIVDICACDGTSTT